MDIYDQLGVKKIINAWGTVTKIGGSKMDPRVLDSMKEAAQSYVTISELHEKAGKYIAKMLGAEAACITSGAAAGIAISAAACMTGKNVAKALQLPDTSGIKNEVLVLKCHRTLYDQALLLSGVKIKEIGATSFASIEQVEHSISENTTLFFYASEVEPMRGSISVPELMKVLNKYNIPLVVDAAAEIPPTSNILKYLNMGASLVIFSGGKEFRGPQSSGIILGKKELIEACDLNCCPNYSIGRPMKIDKETIAGITKAIEIFVSKDYDKEISRWDKMVDKLISGLSACDSIMIHKGFPIEPGIQPVIIPRAYVKCLNKSAIDLQNALLHLDTAIQVGVEGDLIALNPQCLEDDEIDIVIDGIKKTV